MSPTQGTVRMDTDRHGPTPLKGRRKKGASSAALLLASFATLTVLSAITVFVFAGPMPLTDWALITAILVAGSLACWAVESVWKRITRKRRQYRNTG